MLNITQIPKHILFKTVFEKKSHKKVITQRVWHMRDRAIYNSDIKRIICIFGSLS